MNPIETIISGFGVVNFSAAAALVVAVPNDVTAVDAVLASFINDSTVRAACAARIVNQRAAPQPQQPQPPQVGQALLPVQVPPAPALQWAVNQQANLPLPAAPSHTTPWWAWFLMALAFLGLATGITLGTVALVKGATTAEVVAATATTDKKVDAVEKAIDKVDKKVDAVEKNLADGIIAVGKEVDKVNDNVIVVNDNVKTVDENLDQVKKDLSKEIIADGDKTREAVSSEGRKVRWSIQRSERNFEAISDKLDRLERIKPKITVRVQ